jgi:hypothetical protein
MWEGDANRRLNVWDADGKLVTTTNLPFGFCCPGSAVTVDAQNRLWLRAAVGREFKDKSAVKVADLGREQAAWFRVDASGVIIDTVIAPTLPRQSAATHGDEREQHRCEHEFVILPYATPSDVQREPQRLHRPDKGGRTCCTPW